MKKMSAVLAVLMLASCASQGASKKLVIYSPHPLEFIEPLKAEFTKDTGIEVELIAAGTGELLKRVQAEQAKPLGDILWGGTISTVSKNVELFEPFTSENEGAVLPAYKNNEGNQTRFSTVPSVIMLNTNILKGIKVEGYQDVLNPALKGKIAFADPSLSSSSFEHLVNMLYAMGGGDPEKGWDYVGKLLKNLDGKILSGSSAVYKGVADGEYAVGLTFEEGALNYVKPENPVQVVYMKEGVVSKADGIYIIKGAANMDNAKAFVNFATSKKAQDMLEKLNRRSVRSDVVQTGSMMPFEKINMISDDVDYVNSNKTVWLNKFKDMYTK